MSKTAKNNTLKFQTNHLQQNGNRNLSSKSIAIKSNTIWSMRILSKFNTRSQLLLIGDQMLSSWKCLLLNSLVNLLRPSSLDAVDLMELSSSRMIWDWSKPMSIIWWAYTLKEDSQRAKDTSAFVSLLPNIIIQIGKTTRKQSSY